MDLRQRIIERIKSKGAMNFSEYINMCLYDPEMGYYNTERIKLGAKGDYFTSCHVCPSFGATIAGQIEEFWELLGKKDFTLVEFGAGTGLLCADIIDHLKINEELYKGFRYCIIEKSPYMVQIAKSRLSETVEFYEDIESIPYRIDCVISNELLDNFPVHQVIMRDALKEIFVAFQEELVEIECTADERLNDYFKELNIELAYGFRTEVNLEALSWLEQIAKRMERGFILTIDYGGTSGELYSKRRSCGTLVCYHEHKVNEKVFERIGDQDITAHVNFSALALWGKKFGLQTCGITDLSLFLLSLGFKQHVRQFVETHYKNLFEAVGAEAFITKTLLLEMGKQYKVLIQSKNIDPPNLKGLRYTMSTEGH